MADSSTKSRGSNFTGAEVSQLCASWLHVSQNSIAGSGQKNGAFWDRTLKHYNDNRPKDKERRNVRSLETKWSELKRDVARFAGCYSNVVDANHSGESEEDTIRRSKELYVLKDPKGKEFMYVDQWSLLKDCPRFSITMDDMKQKAAQKNARKPKGKGKGRNTLEKENDSANVEAVIDIADDETGSDDLRKQSLPVSQEVDGESLHFGEQRPQGNKAAKRQRADDSSQRMMAYAQRDMAESSARRLRLAESQYMQHLFSIRVADLDEECQDYFRKYRAKEMRVAMLKLQREEEEEERAFRNAALRTPLPVPTAPPNVNQTIGARDVEHDVPIVHRQDIGREFEAPGKFSHQDLDVNGPHLGSYSAALAQFTRELRED